MADASLPVLMYHGLHANALQHGVFDPVYSVEPRQFAHQLDWLAANGFRTLRLRDLDSGSIPTDGVLITFDDGDVSNAEVALPLLVERGMTAEFFVTSEFVGRPGRLNPADLRLLAAAGMGIQSHGATHRYLADLDDAELDAELDGSKQQLECSVGTRVRAIALPGGRGGERERLAALRLGYVDVLNSEPGCNRRWQPGRYLQRVAVMRSTSLSDFATLVLWRGARPRLLQARYHALRGVKRLFGNRRYEWMRERMLAR